MINTEQHDAFCKKVGLCGPDLEVKSSSSFSGDACPLATALHTAMRRPFFSTMLRASQGDRMSTIALAAAAPVEEVRCAVQERIPSVPGQRNNEVWCVLSK